MKKLMLENYDAVIFDLDGTLIDSMWMWHAIDVEYLGQFGIETPDDLSDCIEGMSFSETAVYFKERFNLSDSLDTIKATWNHMAHDIYCTKVPLKKGVLNFLSLLKAKDYKTSIATSNSLQLATDVTKAVGIDKYFDKLITACMVSGGKPKPDIYIKAADELHVSPEKCLVFEDVTQGIIAGKSAGMTVVAVEDQYSLKQRDQKKLLADYYINDFDEFIEKFC